MALINGLENYAWGDGTINVLGNQIVGVQKISYTKTRKIEPIYGAGSKPISYGYGNYEFTGKITILFDTLQQLLALIPTRNLMDIPNFTVVYSFLSANLSPAQVILKQCRFKTTGFDIAQGDTMIGVDLELVVADIQE